MIRSLLLATALLVPAAAPAVAQGQAGPYLAARIAGLSNDYQKAAEYYDRLLRSGNVIPQVLENAVIVYSVLGRFTDAARVADKLDEAERPSQFGGNARMVLAFQEGRYEDVADLLAGDGVGGALLDGLLGAWARIGAGETEEGLAAFDTLAENDTFASIALHQKALALAMAGDYEAADAVLSGPAAESLAANTRVVAAYAQILSQLGRDDAARELLRQANETFNSPMLQDLSRRLDAGETLPYDLVTNVREGAAEAYFTLAALLLGEGSSTYTLLNARVATELEPDHADALILVANLFDQQGQYRLANEALARVPIDHPSYFGAEIARADILLTSDREEAAIEALQSLTRTHGDEAEVWTAYADALRRLERFEESAEAYSRAIDLQEEITRRDWFLYYARGIAREQTDDWSGAESDFRYALELDPENPNILNYLGYGLVEQRKNLDEALDMIERAVAARPDDGYITDSLGWVFYRLGRFEEAVVPMERAVELEPLDPLINDHLGDVYWAVGREREARFQWRRALSLEPEEGEIDRIRRKLEVGLDVVLDEEDAVVPVDAATE